MANKEMASKETASNLGAMFQASRHPDEPTRFGRIYKPDETWLAKAPAEPILEPDLPIVDTHHHLWDMPGYRYLLDELLADLNTGHNIVATVFEECRAMYRARGPEEMKPVGEVEFVAGVAAMSDSGRYGSARICKGIVGYADLARGDRVAAVLESQVAAGGGRFRGIRYSAGWDAAAIIGNSHGVSASGLYRESKVRAGMRQLDRLGLVLDAWLFHPQLAEAVDLARAFPNLGIVMCHMGGPLGYGPYAGQKDEVFATWKASMVELAKCPNVSVKLGGVMMRLAAYDYMKLDAPPSSQGLVDHWGPYVKTCIDLFGAERCMVESNFPVEKMGIGPAALWNAFKRMTAGASADEKTAIFSGTANKVYRLGL
ncbi:amidohydrolase family protein [soil metagenome]